MFFYTPNLTVFDQVEPAPQGLSGSLEFDQDGYRKDYSLGVYSMALDHGLQKIGRISHGLSLMLP